ncbi:Lsr2 family DNA-binding protein [Kitasatospora sp. NBC_01302]|uniref:Lsr2 family DNA-binding protein n=1 Tax=Kitasatospora sp. NBC_01302 TaxID=2903575 RepID=UPI002E160CBE|nr:Lsr2 family protein [Kitasatospora sp. NBC_01302]
MPSDTANPATVLIAAESIDLSPTEPQQDADAAVRTARSARDEEDLVLLLAALGLPSGEDDLARLAPHLATQAGTAGRPDQTHGGTTVSDTLTAEQTEAGPDSEFGTAVDELLAWAAQHPQAKVQRLADQARQALEKLTAQRTADQAVAAYEAKVANLRAQLAKAEQALREAKAGKSTTAAPAAASGGSELAQPADKATRDIIRAWANQNGRPVADRGSIPQTVLRDWYAAHPDTLAG